MKRKAVLFNLDGALLPMDQNRFAKGYFKLLAQNLPVQQWPHGGFAALKAYLMSECGRGMV